MWVNMLFMGSIVVLASLFGFRIIIAGIQAYKDSYKENLLFVDTLKHLSKTKNIEKLNIETSTDSENNKRVYFTSDNHYFEITITPQSRLLECIGTHREYSQQVLHFVFDYATSTYIDKNISSKIIKNEKKDIKKVNAFMDFVVGVNWDEYFSEEEEKDYHLVKGSLHNIPSISSYQEKRLIEKDIIGDLAAIKDELNYSDNPLKEQFLHLIHTCEEVSSIVSELDNETKHSFQSIFERDISKSYFIFKKLDSDSKQKQLANFEKNLQFMQGCLDEIIQSNKKENLFEVEKHLRLTEEKYKK